MVAMSMIDKLEKEVDLVSRHFDVFRKVVRDEPVGIVKLSEETGHAHHKIRYSLRVLEEEGLIDPTSEGAVTTDKAVDFLADFENSIDEIIERLEDLSEIG